MKYNYHTHTSLCHHAKGTNEEYVLAAIEAGFDEIGFADHTPWNFEDFVSGMRMTKEELPFYCESIKALREKYKDKISIKLGLECEYFPKYIPWLKEKIEEHQIDFIILGHHFSVDEPGSTYNGNLSTEKELFSYCDDILTREWTRGFSPMLPTPIFLCEAIRFLTKPAGKFPPGLSTNPSKREFLLNITFSVFPSFLQAEERIILIPHSGKWLPKRRLPSRWELMPTLLRLFLTGSFLKRDLQILKASVLSFRKKSQCTDNRTVYMHFFRNVLTK